MTSKTTASRRGLLRMSVAAAGATLPFAAARADDLARPATPMPAIEAYAGSPAIDEITLSPDGARIAYVTQTGDEKFLVHFRLDEDTVHRIALGPAKVRNLFWGDNDHVVLTNSVTTDLPGFAGSKHEFLQARSVAVATADVNTLFSHEDNFYAIVMGEMHRIKTEDGYRVTAANVHIDVGYNRCLYSFKLDSTRGHLIHEGSNETESWVVLPDGFPLAYADFDDERKEWSLFYNSGKPGSSRWNAIYKTREGPWPSLEGLGRDGSSVVIYIERPKDEETAGDDENARNGDYYEISADGVLSPPVDIARDSRTRSALFHPTTQRLAGFARHGDWFTYDYFDPLLKKLADALPVVLGDNYRCRIADFAEDPRKMIIYGEGPQDPGSYYYADFSPNTAHGLELVGANYDLPEEWVTEKQPFDYKAADGLNIHAYLTLPPFRAAKNLPLIVLPHGGPQSRDTAAFDWQAQVLAAHGYAVLQPNFRGSSGYGDAFVKAGHGEWGRKMQTDLSDGVRQLATQGTIDPRRVAILGASYGGYAAMAGATLDQGIYRCAVAIAGVSDLKDMIEFETDNAAGRSNSDRVLYWKRFMGDKAGWADISPARQAAKTYCPILLIHGTDDTVVPIGQSRRMEKALKEAGRTVEFVTYKGQDHWETIGSSRIEMMKAALDFLNRYNPADATHA